MTKQRVNFVVDGRKFGSISRFVIPPRLASLYVEASTVALYEGSDRLDIAPASCCELCERPVDGLPGHTLLVCSDIDVNRWFNYPARICIYCEYWLMVRRGYDQQKVPRKIRAELSKPRNIDKILPT